MDHSWNNRGEFEEFLHQQQKNQQQTCFSQDQQQVNQLDLSLMINDLMPNEQYPYNMELGESLAELSPESQILLEDAVSLGSTRSPLSDDYTSSNISTQSSPLSNEGEYLCNDALSFDVKKEEISPRNSLVDLIGDSSFDELMLDNQQTNLIQTLQDVNVQDKDFQLFLQTPEKKKPDTFCNFMPQQLNVENKAMDGFHFGVDDNQVIKFKNCNDTSYLNQALQTRSVVHQEQHQNVIDLLKKKSVNERQIGKTQSKNKERKTKKVQKSKKEKKEQSTCPKVTQSESGKTDSLTLETTTVAKSQNDLSKTFSQVVMIPQVVFTNGNCQTVTTQPGVTAYLASSDKPTMTALPIKIVSANSSEVDKIPINPLGKRSNESMISKKAEKVERKTNHNEVEKRYRKSITSSLEELKDLVFGSETRSTKAGILKKAMEHIKHLRKINQRLKQENMQLKMAQKQTSLVDLVKSNVNGNNTIQITTEDFNEEFSSEDDEEDDLPMSEEDTLSGEGDSVSNTDSLPLIESVQGSAFSMMNKQRFFLSMFMFAFMFLGPSKLFFGSDAKGSSVDYTSPHAGGRTILSVDANEEDGFKGYTKLIVNCILYLLFFAWLLIKGEPRYPRGCKHLSLFRTFLKKADSEMKQGDFTTASVYIERGLQIIGRPLSLSKFDMIPSLFWHCLCHILHQIGILPLLKYLGWLILPRRLSLNEAVHRYKASCLLAAEAYSKLLDLALLDSERGKNLLLCAKLSMAAINMAENAESLADNELLTKVYINTAVLLRMKVGKISYPFMNYYINRARSALSNYTNDVPRALNWIMHPTGKSFILSGDWDLNQSSSHKINSCKVQDPLRMIGYQYLMYQVKMTLKHVMAPTASVMTLQGTENELSLLKQLSHDGDSVSKWWYSIIAPVFYIQYGMKDKAKQAWYPIHHVLPESNPLACDLYNIIDCYFSIDDGIGVEELESRLQIAEDHLLRNFIFEQGKESKDELFEMLASACAEMALIVRVEHWESSNSGAISIEQLTKFEQDLNILKELSKHSCMVSHKVEHYSKILRVMVGSNPIHLTKQLLAKRNRCQVRESDQEKKPAYIEEMQEAKTLLFVFKHLSEVISKYCPKGYINHLQNAGLTLEKCGMLEMTEECKKLLATLQTT